MTTAAAKPEVVQPKGFLDMLDNKAMLEEVRKVCPGFLNPVTLFRVAKTQYRKTPRLRLCTPENLMTALMDSAKCGLIPDGQYGHIVPYGRDNPVAQFIPDWKGLCMLGMKSDEVRRWRTDVICQKDIFEHDRGRIVKHTWDIKKDRGDAVAYYSEVTYANGEEDFELITRAQAEAVKRRTAAVQKGKDTPWNTDFDEMARKTALKKQAKRLGHVLTEEFALALEHDPDQLPEIDITQDVEEVQATEKLQEMASQAAQEPAAAPEDDLPMDPPAPLTAEERASTADAQADEDHRLDLTTIIEDWLTATRKKSAITADEFLKRHACTSRNWRQSSTETLVAMAKEVEG